VQVPDRVLSSLLAWAQWREIEDRARELRERVASLASLEKPGIAGGTDATDAGRADER
jgi:hypothetical protein